MLHCSNQGGTIAAKMNTEYRFAEEMFFELIKAVMKKNPLRGEP